MIAALARLQTPLLRLLRFARRVASLAQIRLAR
jgi:hypothetical protein